jgi:hypothetical protein
MRKAKKQVHYKQVEAIPLRHGNTAGLSRDFRYAENVDLQPILATAVGIAAYRAVASPLASRYRSWRDGPRVQVARRNWRGVYVPDLAIRRGERTLWLAVGGFVVVAGMVGWTIMVPA